MKRLILMLLLIPLLTIAQKEGNIWYFGEKAGLDFNSGSPVVLTNGAMSAIEACASISDDSGSLLFYTNGVDVYNKNHVVMLNGSGLFGNISSTQVAIVKKPGSSTNYYIFTTDVVHGVSASEGLNFSEVDMSMDGGFGGVTGSKNILIEVTANEKVCIVKHQNGIDFWVISKIDELDTYHAYLLTAAGLNMTPVVNNIGTTINLSNGYLKASSDGGKIVGVYNIGPISYSAFADHIIELFDFDNSTGLFSNYLSLIDPSSYSEFYGAEFSTNAELLYVSVTNRNIIYQYNLIAGSQAAINASKVGIPISGPNALQMAPDGKIYVSQSTSINTLGVINVPNELGLACNFDSISVVFPAGYLPKSGLPNFISSYIRVPEFNSAYYCYGDSTHFFSYVEGFTALSWNFGDSASGINNFSASENPKHLFTKTGSFVVSLSISYIDTVHVIIDTILIKPELILASDTVICEGEILVLDVSIANATYLWGDGSTISSNLIDKAGTYIVTVSLGACSITDSIEVTYNVLPTAFVSGGDTICEGEEWKYESITTTGVPPFSVIWSNGTTNTLVSGNQLQMAANGSGVYTLVSVHDGAGCLGSVSGSANFLIYPPLVADFDISPEVTFVDEMAIDFTNFSTGQSQSLWDFGDGVVLINNQISFTRNYTQSGDFIVQLTISNDNGCTAIKNNGLEIIPFEYFVPTSFSPNADDVNDLFNINTTKVEAFDMKIFNRWGAMVYSTKDVNASWDGTKNSLAVEQGVYTYKILIIDSQGGLRKKVGSVLLVR